MSPTQKKTKRKMMDLCCGHRVPLKLNKFDDDLGWCPKCRRWLFTGKLEGR